MDNEFTRTLIYEQKYSIPDLLCDDIIEMFEGEKENHSQGLTLSGVKPEIKNTMDMNIPKNHSKWQKIEKLLYKELSKALEIYTKQVKSVIKEYDNIFSNDMSVDAFMIQKYIQQEGKYIYHNDFSIDYESRKHRIITFVWYLNDVEDGGETEFFGEYKIKPEKGKLVLFPATWCFPHRGCMPISSNKYIITNWFYT